ncbi:MAG: zinc-ribbon domain-containing protein [Candidatus Nitrosopolaris sp.]|jgi:hypothetical protein
MRHIKKSILSIRQFLYPFCPFDSREIVINTPSKKNNQGSIWDFLAGLVMGMIGHTILTELIKPNCPKCGNSIQREITSCPKCGTELEWK